MDRGNGVFAYKRGQAPLSMFEHASIGHLEIKGEDSLTSIRATRYSWMGGVRDWPKDRANPSRLVVDCGHRD